MTIQTPLDEFTAVIQNDSRTDDMTADDISLTFDRLHEKCVKRAEDDKNQAEKRRRKAIDALRSEIRHLEPPVRVTDSWDDIRPRVESLSAYAAIDIEDDRLSAFAKVIKRLQEKEEEYKKEAEEKKRDREHREHRDRERDREPRTNGYRRRDERAYSRTPELDSYEVDRRRAAADRERRYRRGSGTGLSPPPTSHGRRRGDSRELSPDRRSRVYRGDRYRGASRDGDIENRDGRLSSSIYDIERQSRAVERERAHYSRADPREVTRALDYGEDDAGSMTGRGDSAGARKTARSSEEPRGQRDSKRRKVEGSKSPVIDTPMAEAVELQSGSEEGEIEEVEVKPEVKSETAA
jgi:pre-mRNA-processing factor 40